MALKDHRRRASPAGKFCLSKMPSGPQVGRETFWFLLPGFLPGCPGILEVLVDFSLNPNRGFLGYPVFLTHSLLGAEDRPVSLGGRVFG